jgi:hypothetical protein
MKTAEDTTTGSRYPSNLKKKGESTHEITISFRSCKYPRSN